MALPAEGCTLNLLSHILPTVSFWHPSTYTFLAPPKDTLRGRHFADVDKPKRNVDEELRRFSQGFHPTGIQHLTKGGKAFIF